ncbi:MAG: glucose-6-phosphate isomerase [Clostridiales Family XIII bacterium]|jgi:glucose-6-phosphate isomerase|nr:glucose-6-phosphate isomerase [Clostridiales Family XIII bacterium]
MRKTGHEAERGIELEFLGCPEAQDGCAERLEAVYEGLISGREGFTGWAALPERADGPSVARVLEAAARIRSQSEALVVIGIGGSYLGARAALELLGRRGRGPELLFAGQNISGTYHADLLDAVSGKELSVCVVSKSGTTTEPSIAFAVFRDLLHERYGREGAAGRIYAITDPSSGTLRAEADAEGYTSFEIPPDIGGRYSVLTPVGLLPMAVAGIDIAEALAGARLAASPALRSLAGRMAGVRKALMDSGKSVEVFEQYEPSMFFFTEWMKQLFGESEGKEGKGLFPAGLSFSTDLHSMGQFLQEGSQIFFETLLDVKRPPRDLAVPAGAGPLLAGKSMNEVNRAALEGVVAAHRAAGVPIIRVGVPDVSPHSFGQMVFFFQLVCAFTGRLMGVDPFNQPGVERYKSEMKRLLGAAASG